MTIFGDEISKQFLENEGFIYSTNNIIMSKCSKTLYIFDPDYKILTCPYMQYYCSNHILKYLVDHTPKN